MARAAESVGARLRIISATRSSGGWVATAYRGVLGFLLISVSPLKGLCILGWPDPGLTALG